MEKRTVDLWPIGNCQTSALIDRQGHMIWACLPRVDGDPVFSALLSDHDPADPNARGFWAIDLEDCVSITQEYVRNTPVLRTRQTDRSPCRVADPAARRPRPPAGRPPSPPPP